jgi:hypothetical protein
VPVSLKIEGLDRLDSQLRSLPDVIEGGVKVVGAAAAYALVWEWGSARLSQPGPKTLWSTNPDGNPAILTKTAPLGYIRVNHDEYLRVLKQELALADWADKVVAQWPEMIKKHMIKVSDICAAIIAQTAPIDTGQLRESLVAVAPDDPILEYGTPNLFGPTELGLGTGWL